MKITLAEKSDKKLIKRFYKSQHYSASFIGLDHCYIVKCDEAIIACVIISSITEQYDFLHALVVDKRFHRQKLASKLLTHTQSLHHPIACFANNLLSTLYTNNGYSPLSCDKCSSFLPEEIYQRYRHYRKKQLNLKVFIST